VPGQTFVGAAGLGLVAANYWTGAARHDFAGGALTAGANAAQTAAAHKTLKILAVELLFVGGAVLIAGQSPAAGAAMSAMIAALFVLWAIHHYGSN
jgi:hypothetical protein